MTSRLFVMIVDGPRRATRDRSDHRSGSTACHRADCRATCGANANTSDGSANVVVPAVDRMVKRMVLRIIRGRRGARDKRCH